MLPEVRLYILKISHHYRSAFLVTVAGLPSGRLLSQIKLNR